MGITVPKTLSRIFGGEEKDIADYESLARRDSDAESQDTLGPESTNSDDRKKSSMAGYRQAQDYVQTSRAWQKQTLLQWQMATTILASLLALVLLCWTARELEARRGSAENCRWQPDVPQIDAMHGGKIGYDFDPRPDVYSPAAEATKWKPVVFHNGFHGDVTPWQGPPSDDVDRRWEEIYTGVGVIKITADEAAQLPNQTLPIPEEDDGYIVGIEVYHQLHCLDIIRRALYPDRYGGDRNMSPDQKIEYWIHLEHCIDNLRQVLVCYSDISIIPWKINDRLQREFPDAHTVHMCRDFDALTEWMLQPSRHFPQEKYQARVDALHAREKQ